MTYDRIEYTGPKRRCGPSSPLKNLKNSNTYEGHLSTGARKRLKRAIQLLVAIAEPKKAMNWKLNKEFSFRLNFVTLTLPGPQGNISDKDIKSKVLDVWIKAAKRRFKLRSYIWRAERQANGNLHFHIVSDTYLPYDQLRDTWNDRLNTLGFIDKFEAKHGHRHPNSTDVHAIHNVRNVAGYFMKYMAKGVKTWEDYIPAAPIASKAIKELKISPKLRLKRIQTLEESKIQGKVWDCSTNLKTKANCEGLIEGDAEAMLNLAYADDTIRRMRTEH